MLSMVLTLTKQKQTSKNNIYIVPRPSPHLVSFFFTKAEHQGLQGLPITPQSNHRGESNC